MVGDVEQFSSKQLFRAAQIKRIDTEKLSGPVNLRTVVPAYVVFQGLEGWKDWFMNERNHKDSEGKYLPELHITNAAGVRLMNLRDPIYDMRENDPKHRFRAPYVLIFGTDEENGLDGKFLVHGTYHHNSKEYSGGPTFYHSEPEPKGLEILINLEDEEVRDNFVEVLRNKGNPMPFPAELHQVRWDTDFDWYLNGWRKYNNEKFELFDGTEPIESMERIGKSETITLTDFTHISTFRYNLEKLRKTLQCSYVSRTDPSDENFLFETMRDLRKVGCKFRRKEDKAMHEFMVESGYIKEPDYDGLAKWDHTVPRGRR